MGKALPVGVDDFKTVREKYYFVDKTFFIKELIEGHSQVTLITRPRRFGKTLAISMLKYFFDINNAQSNKKLFNELAIDRAEYMVKQGKYPVIFLTLKDCKYNDWQGCYASLKDKIADLYDQYGYLLQSNQITVREKNTVNAILNNEAGEEIYAKSLALLTKLLYKYHGIKPIILIDEYDVPIQYAWEYDYYEQAISFMKVWLADGLKGNIDLEFAVLTGVLRVAKESIFSDLNNLEVSSIVTGAYQDVFGFNQSEIEQIAKDYDAIEKIAEIKAWYNGYIFGNSEIYNPWSVVNYFKFNCDPQAYWVNTSGNGVLKQLLKHTDAEQIKNLLTLLEGNSIIASIREGVIYTDIYKDQDALYTMLVTTGYLKIVEQIRSDGISILCRLAIPNQEVKAVYRFEVLDKVRKELAVSDLMMMMEYLLSGNSAKFMVMFNKYLLLTVSTYDTANKESFYHGLMLGMVALLMPEYNVKSNRESGYGRFDLAIFPKDKTKTGVVMEFKVAANEDDLNRQAKQAVAQIHEKNYLAEFNSQGIENVQCYGIAFCGKKMKLIQG